MQPLIYPTLHADLVTTFLFHEHVFHEHCHCHKRWLKIRVENVTKLLGKFIKL